MEDENKKEKEIDSTEKKVSYVNNEGSSEISGHRHIKGRLGVRTGKVVFACAVWAISLIIFLFTGILFLGSLYGSSVSFAIWITLFGNTFNVFVISVPEVTGLITVNFFNGYMESYGTGLHFKYPWEQVKDGNYINMRIVTEQYNEDFPSKDGPLILEKWSIQYRPTIVGLPKYVAVDESTIHDGFGDLASSYLSYVISTENAIRAREKVKEFEEGMRELFEKTPAEIRYLRKEQNEGRKNSLINNIKKLDKDDRERTEKEDVLKTTEEKLKRINIDILKYEKEKEENDEKGERTKDDCTLEAEYGIDLYIVALSDTNYEPKYQNLRATQKISQDVDELVEKLMKGQVGKRKEGEEIEKEKQLTKKEAYNLALIMLGSVTKNVYEAEGTGGNAILAALSGVFTDRSKTEQTKGGK